MRIFKIKSPMEDTYDDLCQETIENGHNLNFIFNNSTGECVEVLYDDVPFECFYGKKVYVTPSMLNIAVNDSETIIIPLSKVKYFKIKENGEN